MGSKYHSPIWGLHAIQGTVRFFYNGNTSLTNCRFTAQVKNTTANQQRHMMYFFLRCSSKEPLVDAYLLGLRVNNFVANSWCCQLYRYKSGTETALTGLYNVVTGAGTLTDWQQFRVSVVTESGNPVVRADWFNGSSWQMFFQFIDSNVNKVTTPGYMGFGFREQYDGNFYIDDVNLTQLTWV